MRSDQLVSDNAAPFVNAGDTSFFFVGPLPGLSVLVSYKMWFSMLNAGNVNWGVRVGLAGAETVEEFVSGYSVLRHATSFTATIPGPIVNMRLNSFSHHLAVFEPFHRIGSGPMFLNFGVRNFATSVMRMYVEATVEKMPEKLLPVQVVDVGVKDESPGDV